MSQPDAPRSEHPGTKWHSGALAQFDEDRYPQSVCSPAHLATESEHESTKGRKIKQPKLVQSQACFIDDILASARHEGRKRHATEVVLLLRKAVKRGHALAAQALAIWYPHAIGVRKN